MNTHPQFIQDVDEFVSSSEQIWRNLALYHLLTNGSSAVNGCRQNECFLQINSFVLSFWRHPFTAEDPLASKWCNAKFLQIWWRNKLIYILDGLRVRTFSVNYHFFNSSIFYSMHVFQQQLLYEIPFTAIRINSENCHVFFFPFTIFTK